MDRKELLEVRTAVFEEYKERVRLGEFDTNSKTIATILNALVEILNHLLDEARKREREANVHGKTANKADKVSTGRSS